MKTEKITLFEAEAKIMEYDLLEQWRDLKALMSEGDELVSYCDVEVYSGFCSGDEGIALSREGRLVAKIVLAVIC